MSYENGISTPRIILHKEVIEESKREYADSSRSNNKSSPKKIKKNSSDSSEDSEEDQDKVNFELKPKKPPMRRNSR